jgi:hypothetical protein
MTARRPSTACGGRYRPLASDQVGQCLMVEVLVDASVPAARLHQRHKAAPRSVSSASVARHCRITSQLMDMTSSFALLLGKPLLSETVR